MDLRRHPGAGAADADRRGERDVLATRDQRVELLVERQDDDALVGTQALEERLTELLRVRAMSLQFGGEIVVDVERAGDRRRHADSAGRARTRPNLHPASVYHSSSARPASASIASVDSRVNLCEPSAQLPWPRSTASWTPGSPTITRCASAQSRWRPTGVPAGR